jgi:peroxiredoxin Q/BCP
MLEEGKKAPAFSLKDQKGKTHALKDYLGQWVLIYFYPKDNTPGCTKQACMLRDNYSDYKKLDAVVLGVSKDSIESHEKFAKKFELPFPILADPETKMIQKYGAWQEKSMFGNKYMGIQRMSYLIDPKGKIAKIYPKAKPMGHATTVLKDLKALQK